MVAMVAMVDMVDMVDTVDYLSLHPQVLCKSREGL